MMVVHDFGDDDLLVIPVTSHPARGSNDVSLSAWKSAGLKLPSTARVEKFATIAKSCVVRNQGKLPVQDRVAVEKALAGVLEEILPGC